MIATVGAEGAAADLLRGMLAVDPASAAALSESG